jgi:hypothetical protein
MKLLTSLAGIGVLVASTAFADAKEKPYTLGDLKTLVSQKAYEEAVGHLGDLRPSERTAEWLDVAVAAASGYVAQLPTSQIMYAIEAIDRAFPQVLTSPKYTQVRAEQGLKSYGKCLAESDACLESATRFLEADPSNTDLALKMSKVVLRSFSSKYTAAPFFKRAVSGKAPGAACKDEDLKTAMVAALGLPKSYDGAAAGRAIADVCWNEQKKTVSDQLTEAVSTSSGYVRANTCEVLKAKQALTADQTRICAKDKDD